jgi:asparagine synthase (glutamine-hydrolysing)
MCGITGQINFVSSEPAAPERLRQMTSSILHRGPDDEGYFFDGPLGLGFRRLSIIDLSGGHQPMSDQDETVWVVFNGEIYNYKELRKELQAKGHVFRTSSDTEVIVHGYKEWGPRVLNHLNGMFGLAIWDVRRRRLLVARDAMGIKLIYYKLKNGKLTFGSEVRAITAGDETSPSLDPTALQHFLHFRYTPSPLTLFQGIHKLPPGAMLVVEDGTCREERWYTYTPRHFTPPKSDAQATEELLELYRAAMKRHLLADVPVGVLLSGGLDSGLLLALMNESGKEWPAYTIGFGESFEDDELKQAAETARLLGAKHVPLQLTREQYERSLPDIVAALEEPVTSSSIVPLYFICQRARQDVKVALIGQGPDELFGGYKRHWGVHYGSFWRQLPGPLRSGLGSLIRRLPRNEMLKRGVHALAEENRLRRYQRVFDLAPAETIASLFQPGVRTSYGQQDLVPYWETLRPQIEHLDELGGFQMLELRSSLPDELLLFGDKLSMAHSLELRVPYLDREVVEYAQCLPAHFKLRDRKGKWLHRQVCKKYLDPRILNRPKLGFAVNVVDGWFKNSVKSGLTDLLTDPNSKMYSVLDRFAVQRLLADHRSGRSDNYKLLFSLIMVEQWLGTISRGAIAGAGADSPRPNLA